MRKVPETLPDKGLLVGWSLEAERRKPAIGFTAPGSDFKSPSKMLEPILDSSEGHLISVAPTGAGKGVGCIIPALLRYPGPVVVIDPKGENYAVTAQRRRNMGQEVILLDPFGVTPDADTQRFNPMDLADPESQHFVEDVSTLAGLADSTQDSHANYRDPFWPQMGRILVSAVIMDVLTMPDSDDATLPAARTVLNQPLESLAERSKQWLRAPHPELRQLAGMLNSPAPQTMGGYWAYALNQLDFLKGEMVCDNLAASDLDLNKVLRGDPLSIYLVLPPDKLESHAALLRLWIGSLVSVLSRRSERPKQPTLMLVDEAAQLGELPQLRAAMTLLRGYGVRVWTFWQDLSQLRRLYPNDWETILNNCRIQQFFGATTGMAADAVSKVSGYGTRQSVLALEPDELILNVSGDEPVVVRRPNYLIDPPFANLFSPNPFYRRDEKPPEPKTRAVFRRSEAPAEKVRRQRAATLTALGKTLFHPVAPEHWETVAEQDRDKLLGRLGLPETVIAEPQLSLKRCALSFYEDYDWYVVQDERHTPTRYAYFVASDADLIHLTGRSDPIYQLNQTAPLKLTSENVIRYLRFFCTSLVNNYGRFLIISSADDIAWTEDPDEGLLEHLYSHVAPPRITKGHSDSSEGWLVDGNVVYGPNVFSVQFGVEPTGEQQMLDDSPLATELPIIDDSERLRHIGVITASGEIKTFRQAVHKAG